MCFIILIAAGPHGGGPGQVCPGVLSTRCTLHKVYSPHCSILYSRPSPAPVWAGGRRQ